MNIVGVDVAAVGVADVESARRFCGDFGLRTIEAGVTGFNCELSDRTQLIVRAAGDRGLAGGGSDAAGIRETVWGVGDAETLGRIGAELERDRNVSVDTSGVLHATDDSGLAIAFQVTARRRYEARPALQNAHGLPPARGVNARFDFERPIELRSIGHVVYFVPDVDAAERFYVERLGFRVSDRFYPPAGERWMRGSFLRAAGSNDHHTVFFIEHAGAPAHLDHIEFHVTDFNDVMLQGQRVAAGGWPTVRGPGRHIYGSNYFWYFASPLGGDMELGSDMDYADDDWEPHNVEFSRRLGAAWTMTPPPAPVPA